ncbi:hypothetical protein P170DRAFT_193531 [Aspergillus steynii IBT 23096]|uniref:Zn(2)-C6 fungal-type domain-containing protein n=1 Tax=Aspergillus steynii IBT 23096 TaxID=1392250 RepID=A0A2I2G3P2_9EURO|nr:uncharacterized protein P170DRAFT_193531 [Aspergillus steynii IBT 23096]PLB47495.1 hypothetical protein P170DRAFT_193531 [Aspergillus steynii IBT 23096]
MPRLGPACLTCREKCRKCDRARPACNRCITKGLDCGGYPEQFRFCGIASRGKWKGAQLPVGGRSARASSSRVARQPAQDSPTTELLSADTPKSAELTQASPTLVKPIESPENPSDEIVRILGLAETETLLSHYDSFICPHQISEIGDDMDNPYRSYILPLARQQIGLLYAVLGLSASHLGKLTDNATLHDTTAVEYRLRAIRALSKEIRRSQSETLLEVEQDAVLAIIQILLLHDISETGVSTHGIHITGAMSVCKRLLIADGLSGNRQRAVFFLGNLAWLDIIRAFAGAERLCFSQDIREMVAFASDRKFELVNGCPRDIFLIIGGVLEKAKEYTLGWLTWDEFQIALLLAKHKLYSWDQKSFAVPTADPRWPTVAEVFRFACILRILRLLDPYQPASAPEIQDCVTKILDATAKVPADCSIIELLIMPLFMAGADTLVPHSQYYVMSRLNEIERRSEFRNPVPMDLLRKVWDARAIQSPDDERNISWMEFVSSFTMFCGP